MQGPEGPQPRDGTAEAARGGATATAGETAANNTPAEAAVGASSAEARFEPPPEGGAAGRNDRIACQRQGEIQPPPEGGTAGRDEEIVRLLYENLELRIRAEIQVEERDRAERMQERRYKGTGGGMNSSEQRGQPGTFIVGFGKPAPKLENMAGSYFPVEAVYHVGSNQHM